MAGLRPCLWTVQRCREQAFQQFMGVDSEQAAADAVRERCAIETRAQLDRDPAAKQRWDERVRRPYLKYQQHPTTHHK